MPLFALLIPVIQKAVLWVVTYVGLKFVLKFLIAIGLSSFTYDQITAFWETMRTMFNQQYNSMPSIVLSFLDIGGFTTGIEIMFSGITFLIGWFSVEVGFRFYEKG